MQGASVVINRMLGVYGEHKKAENGIFVD